MTSSTQGFLKEVGRTFQVVFVVMIGIAISDVNQAYAFEKIADVGDIDD